MQLDSIADVMNFGCAPGLLLYCYGFVQMDATHPTLVRMGGMACFFFVACGALRLARFNVNVGRTDPRYFVGMPITAGAACVPRWWWPGRSAHNHPPVLRRGGAAGRRRHPDGVHRPLPQLQAPERATCVLALLPLRGAAGGAADAILRAVLPDVYLRDAADQCGLAAPVAWRGPAEVYED